MDKLKMHSLDGVERNIELIGKLFPNAISVATNFEQIFETYSHDTVRKVL